MIMGLTVMINKETTAIDFFQAGKLIKKPKVKVNMPSE